MRRRLYTFEPGVFNMFFVIHHLMRMLFTSLSLSEVNAGLIRAGVEKRCFRDTRSYRWANSMRHQPKWWLKWPPVITLNPAAITLYPNCSRIRCYTLCALVNNFYDFKCLTGCTVSHDCEWIRMGICNCITVGSSEGHLLYVCQK